MHPWREAVSMTKNDDDDWSEKYHVHELLYLVLHDELTRLKYKISPVQRAPRLVEVDAD